MVDMQARCLRSQVPICQFEEPSTPQMATVWTARPTSPQIRQRKPKTTHHAVHIVVGTIRVDRADSHFKIDSEKLASLYTECQRKPLQFYELA